MKKLLVLITVLFLFINSYAQTYVSGGIYSNETWTPTGSPYIITDTVVIFAGDTVTILPGVVVKFDNNKMIDDRGDIIAIGTAADSIIFTSNSAIPYAGIYNGINNSGIVNTKYCRFSYANTAINYAGGLTSHCLFISNLNAIYFSNNLIDTCIFKYDTGGVEISNGALIGCEFIKNGYGLGFAGTVQNCIFIGNYHWGASSNGPQVSVSYCIFDSNSTALTVDGDTVRNCSIKFNGVGILSGTQNFISFNDISDNYIGIETFNGDVTSCNTICGNTHYNIVDEGGSDESYSNNYWCLPDSAHIQATIYDAYQNINLAFVFFTPFETTPCTLGCNLFVSATATNAVVCAGDSTILSANITDPNPVYTAVWNPGNHTGTTFTVTPLANTTYTLVVTDSSGCSNTAYITIDTSCSTPPPNCNLFVSAIASPSIVCSGSPSTLSAIVFDSNTVYTAVWNPGSHTGTTYTVTPLANTTYTVVVTDSSGCTATAFVTVDTMYCSPPPPCGSLYPPSICYVTTDTSCTFNTVVWQKTGMDTLAIDSVIIYRLNVLAIYVPIGEVSVHTFSTYKDYGARPLVEPSFYTLGIHDTCGSDTTHSNFNETVFLQSVSSGPNTVNLSWNLYQGSPVIYYRILRDDSGTGNWHAIDSVVGYINAYTDRNAPVNPGLRYLLSVDWNVVCTPSIIHPRHGSRYIFNTNGEYSNVTKVFPTNIVSLADHGSIKVYPNPVNDVISISFNNAFEGIVKITDVLGQDVYSTNISADGGSVKKINVNNLSNGVYFITLEGNGKLYRTKIIKM